jgi:hypothetical protein
MIRQLEKRPPKTEKEQWFLDLIARRGARCTADERLSLAWNLTHNARSSVYSIEFQVTCLPKTSLNGL